MLSLRDVNAYYGKSHVLNDVTLSVRAGEIVSLLGRNGVGKTTLLKSIMGLLKQVSGEITFQGKSLRSLKAWKISRLGITYLPQERNVFPELTVAENMRIRVSTRGSKSEDIREVLESFPILSERLNQVANTLSGGERMILSLAAGLAADSDLIILDEPSAGVMPIFVDTMGALLQRKSKGGKAVFIVEQNLRLALTISDKVMIMDNGVIHYVGLPRELEKDRFTINQLLGVGT